MCVCVCVVEKHSCHKGRQDLSCHISSCWSSLEQDGQGGNSRTKPSGDIVGALLYKVLRRYFFKQALDVPVIFCWAAEDGKEKFSVQTLNFSADPKGSCSGKGQFWHLSSLGSKCLPCPGSLYRDAAWDFLDKITGN